MPLLLPKPILYLITRGATAEATTSASIEFQDILGQVSAAVAAGVTLIQLREKKLTARVLFDLTACAAEITRGTSTRLLVNDRADIASGAGADGVHLMTRSLEPKIVRRTFGDGFLIGASTHSLAEATNARDGGADFIVFGPIFPTPSKDRYGPPLGLHRLADVTSELAPFPVLALGGISIDNARECLRAGASGVAGISLFHVPENLSRTCAEIGKLSQIHSGVVK
jgi:thiamine-phosphate pyrophosphorylase